MAEKCLQLIHICRIRATRLDAVGNPTAGPNNVYVSDKAIQLGVTPVLAQGDDKELRGGCGCLIGAFKGDDQLKRFDLDLDIGSLQPGLFEMLTGATLITDAGTAVGIDWPELAFDCSAVKPFVCFEAWQDAFEDDHPDPDTPYLHWTWPGTKWQIDQATMGAEFSQPKLKGFSRGNPQWGEGIFGDRPAAAGALGGGFYTATLPEAGCGYKSQAIT